MKLSLSVSIPDVRGGRATPILLLVGQLAVACAVALTVAPFIGPRATSTAGLAVAITALAVALSNSRRTAQQAAPATVTEAVERPTIEPVRTPTADPDAAAIMEEILKAARSQEASADDETPTPILPQEVAARRWTSISTAARRSGLPTAAIETLIARGRIAHRSSRAGNRLVNIGEVIAAAAEPEQATDTAPQRIADAIAAGRARLDVTAIATLPSRKAGAVDSCLVLRDETDASLTLSDNLDPQLRSQHDLLAVAFAAATIQSRPAGTADRPMFVRLALPSLLLEAFQDEVEALCDAEPGVASQLVLGLPAEAFVTPEAFAALDALLDRGVRFAAVCPPGASLAALFHKLDRQTYASFAMLPAAMVLAAPNEVAALVQAGVRPVALEVSSEREVVELLDLGVELAAGPLFATAKPAPVHLPTALAA